VRRSISLDWVGRPLHRMSEINKTLNDLGGNMLNKIEFQKLKRLNIAHMQSWRIQCARRRAGEINKAVSKLSGDVHDLPPAASAKGCVELRQADD
jgi:hypothetical protein